MTMPINDEELKKKLTPEEYDVIRNKRTETPFTGKYLNEHSKGMYRCKVCGIELFSSDAKFDSNTGWPSFDEPANLEHIELVKGSFHPLYGTEVRCKNCGAHLGHVFDDGPTATGKRFCINSCSLDLKKSE